MGGVKRRVLQHAHGCHASREGGRNHFERTTGTRRHTHGEIRHSLGKLVADLRTDDQQWHLGLFGFDGISNLCASGSFRCATLFHLGQNGVDIWDSENSAVVCLK